MLSEKTTHELAYCCYNNRQYAKAETLFRFLAMENPTSFDYWFGLGSSLLMQNRKNAAISPFRLAHLLAKQDLSCRLFLVECLLDDFQNIAEAKELLTSSAKLCKNSDVESLRRQFAYLQGVLETRGSHAKESTN